MTLRVWTKTWPIPKPRLFLPQKIDLKVSESPQQWDFIPDAFSFQLFVYIEKDVTCLYDDLTSLLRSSLLESNAQLREKIDFFFITSVLIIQLCNFFKRVYKPDDETMDHNNQGWILWYKWIANFWLHNHSLRNVPAAIFRFKSHPEAKIHCIFVSISLNFVLILWKSSDQWWVMHSWYCNCKF